MNKKAALSIISSTVLLLLVTISVGIFAYQWYASFQQDYTEKNLYQGKGGILEIMEVKTSGSNIQIGLRNKGELYHTIERVKIGSTQCTLLGTYIINNADNILVSGCSLTIDSTYEIVVFTERGVFTKTLTLIE
jgi:hypothetical protein